MRVAGPFLALAPSLCFAALSGLVRDANGGAIAGAEVEIRAASGAVLWAGRSGGDGRFMWNGGARGPARVRATAEGFGAAEAAVVLTAGAGTADLILAPESVYTRVSVNAVRGGLEEAASSAHVTIVKERQEIFKRPAPTLGHALDGEPGVLVQQSTYAQVSPFLRGLTGYQVLNLVDGIRFNNSTFRSGPNQYLAFLEPAQAQRIEAMLGPAGAQYGSDAMGGSIQVITQPARFAATREIHGDILMGGASADLSGFAAGRVSFSGERVYWMGGLTGRRHNDPRAGGGADSRNVYTRLFGLTGAQVNGLVGGRQQDSGFSQHGAETKFAWRPAEGHLATLHYQRGAQEGVRGYKDLLGGLGRLQSAFAPQTLNWFYGRYEKTGLGPLDTVSGTVSVNSQTDGSVRQNLLTTDPVTRDWNRVDAYGYSGQATLHRGSRLLASFGGDAYDERIGATREVTNPATGARTRPRPLYPDDSRYLNLGSFAQASYDLTAKLRLAGGVRFTGVRFATREDRTYGVPASSRWYRDTTFQTTARWQAARAVGLHFVASRGFRAPNLNDLGALGLNDLGYELPAAEAIPAGALLSSDAGEGAVSKGARLTALAAESLMNYEAGVRFTARRAYARVQAFHADLYDPIVRRTLLFPVSGIPAQLAGLPVTPLPQTAAQRAQGVTAVATTLDPRAVKAFVNDGQSRYYGIETLGRVNLGSRWAVEANYSFIAGRDLFPNRPMRRLPPQMGAATLRYLPSGRRPWFETSLQAAGAQRRLSGGDVDDERIGASRRRRDIADFFNGSRVAPLIRGGVFQPTGETLAQIQNRVLPMGATVNGVRVADDNTRVPLYLATAGWASLHFRAGIPLGERWTVMAAVENLLDRNFRLHGSGVDAPGAGAYVQLGFRF